MPQAGTRRRSLVFTACLFALAVLLVLAGDAPPATADPGTTERVSVDSAGNQGNDISYIPAISGDGRYVAFVSFASNLVAGDTNDVRDMFVHDRQTRETTRVSVDSAGNQANGESYFWGPAISGDGRYVAFASWASNLVPSDSNDVMDVFVHDRQPGITTRVSVDSSGNQGNGSSYAPAISGDGRYVAFQSGASNLVPGDSNGRGDIFVHDRQTGQTSRVSVDSSGNQANDGNEIAGISGDGRYVVFHSWASNLVPGDTNGVKDIFLHDRQTGVITRVNVDSAGNQANLRSGGLSISGDGRYVAFGSGATNLVPGDSNGWWDIFVHDRQTGQTNRVSVDSSGNEANKQSYGPAISGDGRYVAFTSEATNLVPGDTNIRDIFVHDRQTGQTTRVSVDSAGNQAWGESTGAAISGDGRYVAFNSPVSNLVPGDTNGAWDIFVHDRGAAPPTVIEFSELKPPPGTVIREDLVPFSVWSVRGVLRAWENAGERAVRLRLIQQIERHLLGWDLAPIDHGAVICSRGSEIDWGSVRIFINGQDVTQFALISRFPVVSPEWDSCGSALVRKYWLEANVNVKVTAQTLDGTAAGTQWSFSVDTRWLWPTIVGSVKEVLSLPLKLVVAVLEGLFLPTEVY